MDTRLTQLNLNTIVFGGSGAGKSRFFVEPNLLQANSSFVVTDPSGELMMKVGKFLEKQGYVIKCLNIERMEESQRYNPFAYVYEDSDIPVMVDALISNIEGPKKGSSGDNKFWDETSRTLLIAICGYLFETQPMERRNFNNVIKLIDLMDVSDERSQPEDELDKLFNDLELANPSSYAVSNYKVIKSAGTGKTAQNIVISTLAIFARFFKLDKIANLTYRDELHLEEIGKRKCALFIVTPQGDTTYNFLASELYTQLFQILYRQGEQNARDRHTTSVSVDMPVRCLIDEAANVGVIPHLPEKVSTMRKYGISIALIYQNQAQVKALMKDDWETLVGKCDTMLFLGGIDASTVKTVSERLGKGPIHTRNNSINKGNRGGGSPSIQTAGRELMTTTEIEQLRNDHCIVFIRSLKPFNDYKYPLEQHPNYRYTGDADEKNFFAAPWHLQLDRALMASLNIKRVGEDGYHKPERAEWTTDAEVAVIKKDQALRRAAAVKAGNAGVAAGSVNSTADSGTGGRTVPVQMAQQDNPDREEVLKRFISASSKAQVKPPMSQEEKERIRRVIEEKKIGLGLDEELKIYQLTAREAEQILSLKEGYAPDMEFDSAGFAFDLRIPEADFGVETDGDRRDEEIDQSEMAVAVQEVESFLIG
ncbi:MAG: type IV secretory system conjugative DNA transfer family protein [Lachnospiraceae bacterium]|nr:type IV secretory system conjugative DNA transfer family protein [Lachnospiraceae bacterium]